MQNLIVFLAILLSDAEKQPLPDLPADVFAPQTEPLSPGPFLDCTRDRDGRYLPWPTRKPVILIA